MELSLFQKLKNIGVFRGEIWPYLTLKDICHLLKVDKYTRLICLELNNQISQKLMINFYNCQENEQPLALNSIFNIFPIISKLILNATQIMEFETMLALYQIESICTSLKDFTVIISNHSSVGISNLYNVEVLDISFDSVRLESQLMECLLRYVP